MRILKAVLEAVALLLRLLPRPLAELLLIWLRGVPTNLGVVLRYPLLKRLTRQCGFPVVLKEDIYLFGLRNLVIGDGVSIHPMCYLNARGGLTIGSNVSIAHATTIMTMEHDFNQPEQYIRDVPTSPAPVTVGGDVWIAAGVRIVGGVTIGDRVVIGAGAVVTKDIPSNSLALGVPAKVVKQIPPYAGPAGPEAQEVS